MMLFRGRRCIALDRESPTNSDLREDAADDDDQVQGH